MTKQTTEDKSESNKGPSTAKVLKLDLCYSRITIGVSEGENFHFTAKRIKEFIWCEKDLVLSQKKPHWTTWVIPIYNWRLPTKAELLVPKSFKGGIVLKNRNGWARLNNLNTDYMEISNRNGKVIMGDIKGETVNVTVNNGKLLFNEVNAETINLSTNNGKIIISGVKTKRLKVQGNNGKILPTNIKSNESRFETKNGKIKGENIASKITDASTRNGKVMLMNLNADAITMGTNNGKIVAEITGEEKHYALDIKTHNGKSLIAGKKNNGSYILRDKDKNKQITASTKNGKIILTFLNNEHNLKNSEIPSGENK